MYLAPEYQAEEHQERLRHILAAWPYRSVIGKVCDWTRQECDRHDGCGHCPVAWDRAAQEKAQGKTVVTEDDGEVD